MVVRYANSEHGTLWIPIASVCDAFITVERERERGDIRSRIYRISFRAASLEKSQSLKVLLAASIKIVLDPI